MKNFTILCFLMLTASAFAQNGKIKVNITSGSAEIKMDGTYVATAFRGTPLVVYATPGVHKLVATCADSISKEKKVKVKKGTTEEVLFEISCPEEEVSIATFDVVESAPIEVAVVEERVAVEEEDPAFLVVEEPATFNGGDVFAFSKWVGENLQYPDSAFKAGIGGKVYVQFAVNKNGEVENPRVLRGVEPTLDAEACRVIKASPKWTAPKQGGKIVKQLFTIPIVFKIDTVKEEVKSTK